VYVSKAFYWGEVCKKYRVENCSFFRYDTDFHDGDHVEGYRSEHFHRLEEAMKWMEKGWLKEDYPPKEYLENTIKTKTPRQLYTDRCRACTQCKSRQDCGQCSVCLQNEVTGSRSGMQCCVQKVCFRQFLYSEHLGLFLT
jgi:hypothetical protein